MIRRKLFNRLLRHLQDKEFSLIAGARQTGKTTLLNQLKEFCRQNQIPVVTPDLNNRSSLAHLNRDPLNLYEQIKDVSNKRTVVLIDEIQRLKDPYTFLIRLFDEYSHRIKIVAFTSAAFYQENNATGLPAGRIRLFPLLTCSFNESLELSGKDELQYEKPQSEGKSRQGNLRIKSLQTEWENYMLFGGYPAVVTEKDIAKKIEQLREITHSSLTKDIRMAEVAKKSAFLSLITLLAEQTGHLVNTNELAAKLRLQNITVSNYLEIMQKCFYIALIRPFHNNLPKELIKMPKVYFPDNGLRNCLLNNFQPPALRTDREELWKNSLFRMLTEKHHVESICHWRTASGHQVDFVLPEASGLKAIEARFEKPRGKRGQHRKFLRIYPEIPLEFAWVEPFEEEFFRHFEE